MILFGSRLPSVARSLGKSLTEFKKGMREFEDEMKSSIYSEPPGRVTLRRFRASQTPPADHADARSRVGRRGTAGRPKPQQPIAR